MNSTPSSLTNYPTHRRHPEWCDRKSCAQPDKSGHTAHIAHDWQVDGGKHWLKMTVKGYEEDNLEPLVMFASPKSVFAVRLDQVNPLVEHLQRAAAMLTRPAVPAPTVGTTTAPDGSRTVTVSTSVTHPAWCDPAECFHEDPDMHPIHRSADVLIPDAGEGFSAGIQQDGPDPATIWSVGPSQFTDMTPKQVRAYAAELLALADRIDPPVAA